MDTSFSALTEFFQHFPIPVVVVDLETTGGHLYEDRITEIAFLHFWQGRVTSIQQLINPERSISEFVQNLTGISDAMVADAPTFAEFAPNVLSLLRGSLIVAHNSKFDYAFLRHEFARLNVAFAAPALCSVQLSRKLYPEFYKHNLDTIIERHNLVVDSRHRAMSDVLALTAFLQLALREKGEGAWLQAAKQLFNPPMLPENLASHLVQAAYALPDSYGVSIWRDARGKITAIRCHEQAFREVVLLLRQPEYARAAQLDFVPTVGALHSVVVRAEKMVHEGLLPHNELLRHTIVFQEVSGCLKARVRPLKAGFRDAPPHGLFIHSKAAKRALLAWAKAHDLCPNLLGILPDELPQGAPCPVSLLGKCSTACAANDIEAHNLAVRAALNKLPVCDWGQSPCVRVTERHVLHGQTFEFLCDSGAVRLTDGTWFVDKELLMILKTKFKTDRKNIQNLSS
ncbi:3'-5' exonuclease [Wielerella bovis]|uniref:3'-5' exonuclease n=1 Tax=Wielerella bovis TaxID=2917790 RepID=UPI00201896CB|nr:3'-5' exonuclease [Wielerella bovis]ULJ62996.1 3'-5' exonuclease [Wielerella bovis]